MQPPARRDAPHAALPDVVFPPPARPAPRADGHALARRLENKYLSRVTGVHTVPGRPERSVPMMPTTWK